MKKMTNSKNITQMWNTKENSSQCGICSGPTDDNWKMLAMAIVLSAAKEYQKACKYDQPKEIQALEKFFKSEWCSALVYMTTGKDFEFSNKTLDDMLKGVKK